MGEFEKGFMAGFLLNYRKTDAPDPYPKLNEWTYPSNWLKLPEPAENQIVLLVDSVKNTSYMIAYDAEYVKNNENTTIDWGDGNGPVTLSKSSNSSTSNSFEYGYSYTPGTGHNTGDSEQWIITITFDKSHEIGTEYLNVLLYTTYAGSKSKMRTLAMKVGNSGYLPKSSVTALDCTGSHIQYIKICSGEFDVKTFNAYNLCKIELPQEVTKIVDRAFQSAYCLFDITMPNVEEIGEYAFYSCYALDPSGKIPKLSTIGKYAFAYTHITDLDFPCLTSIGNSSFNNCKYLIDVTLPENLTTVGEYAFSSSYIQKINLSNVTSIGAFAFQNCGSLVYVTGNKVNELVANTFTTCSNLITVDFPLCSNVAKGAITYSYNLRSCILAVGATVDPYAIPASDFVKIEYK